jgi:hypothetical protein
VIRSPGHRSCHGWRDDGPSPGRSWQGVPVRRAARAVSGALRGGGAARRPADAGSERRSCIAAACAEGAVDQGCSGAPAVGEVLVGRSGGRLVAPGCYREFAGEETVGGVTHLPVVVHRHMSQQLERPRRVLAAEAVAPPSAPLTLPSLPRRSQRHYGSGSGSGRGRVDPVDAEGTRLRGHRPAASASARGQAAARSRWAVRLTPGEEQFEPDGLSFVVARRAVGSPPVGEQVDQM